MFSPLAFTKTYSMAAAAALAITLVPVLMGYFIRGRVLPEHKNPLNRLLTAIYESVDLLGFLFEIEKYEKNNHRHIFDIPRIIFFA